jgi:hypothetical protein
MTSGMQAVWTGCGASKWTAVIASTRRETVAKLYNNVVPHFSANRRNVLTGGR